MSVCSHLLDLFSVIHLRQGLHWTSITLQGPSVCAEFTCDPSMVAQLLTQEKVYVLMLLLVCATSLWKVCVHCSSLVPPAPLFKSL